MMGITDAIGFLAGVLTTVAFIPQALKIYTTKSGNDVSARMLLIFSAGVLLWLVYGMMIGSVPVILANVVTLILSGTIIALKIRYGRPNPRDTQNTSLP
ncbi:MAG TPA: SemiSWEET transporter [Burkholderiales bacterium]|jgi:MtN3 and saliva related transmembrane protein|nr:SemiSWEET transporter [Burkholderiales bacterium]